MKKITSLLIVIFLFGSTVVSNSQTVTKNALFLGNSYTSVNNLPQTTADIANSMGDTLLFDTNTPGGYTLEGHSTNSTSLEKIGQGNWDFVVLQEQSQRPSFPASQVATEVYPFAYDLDSIINAENPCAETVFFMTWGRKNGDATNCPFWPPVCTYNGMDSLLNLRYRIMAEENNALVSPVGAVWNHLRQNNPLIELYQADESHPSVAGTYAAACTFYTILFGKDPSLIPFNSTLSEADATSIKAATKLMVYDNLLEWHVGEYTPSANFIASDEGGNLVAFTNNSENATEYFWDFGDGNTSSEINPSHTYFTNGDYAVQLFAIHCDGQDSTSQIININTTGVEFFHHKAFELELYPIPAKNELNLKTALNLIGKTYEIFDINGKILITGKINAHHTIISIDHLSNGVFLLQVGTYPKQTFNVIKE